MKIELVSTFSVLFHDSPKKIQICSAIFDRKFKWFWTKIILAYFFLKQKSNFIFCSEIGVLIQALGQRSL